MKTNFGNPLMRFLRGGATLLPLEKKLLERLVQALPPILRTPTEIQLEGYNLVQREIDGRALNFYRIKLGRVMRTNLPALPIKAGEIKLLSLAFSFPGDSDCFHATATAIDRYFFCVCFSHDLRPFGACNDFSITEITPSWRSGLVTSTQAARKPEWES
jgi:hypothetical protein